jgi:hypothetical protein
MPVESYMGRLSIRFWHREFSSVFLFDPCCLDSYLSIYVDDVEASLDCVGANLCFGSSQFCKADSVDFM